MFIINWHFAIINPMPKLKRLKKKTIEAQKPQTHRVRPVVEELLPTEISVEPNVESNIGVMEDKEKINNEIKETETQTQEVPAEVQVNDELFESKDKVGFFPLFLITLGVALLVAVVSGGIYVYIQGTGEENGQTAVETSKPSSKPDSTNAPLASSTPIATPVASAAALNTYSLSVLNGSGRIGEAGKVKTLLEKAKFKVSYTGNAKSYDFEKTQLQFKESVPESVRNTLKSTLQSGYEVEVGETLNSKNVYDIVVTVGAN